MNTINYLKVYWLVLLIVFVIPLVSFTNQSKKSFTGSIKLTISNIESQKGQLLVGIFQEPSTFLDRGEFIFGEAYLPDGDDVIEINLPAIDYGTYAIGVVHDLNENTYMDKNLFGVPTEPYGFYQHARGKWSKPTFEECSFVLDSPIKEFKLEISHWNDK